MRNEWLRRDGERSVLVGFVPLYTRTSQRVLVVSRPGEPKLIFHIRLSATPTASERHGAILRYAGENFEIRYRMSNWTKP